MKKRSFYAALISLVLTCLGLAAAAPAQAVVVGLCTITAQNPHGSTHVAGTVNTVGTVSCSMTMTEIYIQTTLEKSNGQYWSGNVRDYFNSSYEMSNAATSCSQGPDSFRTRVSYVIQAPPGVNPRYTANTIYSP